MNRRNVQASPHANFHRNLARWYAGHGRKDLPWRQTRDAYAIYISEIMLQQTQVKTVLERYYRPFLKRFPTLAALARAEHKDVLSAWQGLGYYRRAGHLHEAARRCKGALPQSVDELMNLPGIGKNTAHAIAAFAYRQPVAVMEANVKRVISRIFALTNPSTDELWEKAAALLDPKNPFDYNQAMMDIGAMICTPRAPKCSECPAAAICKGKSSPESYPARVVKKAVPIRKKIILVQKNTRGEYFATPRKTKFLQGLYHFVETTPPPLGGRPGGGHRAEEGRDCHLTQNAPTLALPLLGRGFKHLGSIRQQYSHFTLEADVYLQTTKGSGKNWHTAAALKKLPVSMAEKKILQLL